MLLRPPHRANIYVTAKEAVEIIADLVKQLAGLESASEESEQPTDFMVDKEFVFKALAAKFEEEPKRAQVRASNLWGRICDSYYHSSPFDLRCNTCGGEINEDEHWSNHKDSMEVPARSLLGGRLLFINSGRRLIGIAMKEDFESLCDTIKKQLESQVS